MKPKGLRKRDLSPENTSEAERHSISTAIESHPIIKHKGSSQIISSNTGDIEDTKQQDLSYSIRNVETMQEKNKRLKDLTATAEAEYHTEKDRDFRAILEKSLELNKVLKGTEDVYKGKNYYKAFLEKKDNKSTNAASQKYKAGPVRAATNIRNTVRFDYQPHVCKDYKETGTCGFGDSCVFVHDRSDYKMGWELDLEWEESQKKLKSENDSSKFLISDNEHSTDEDDIPNICFICSDEFVHPVMTKCKHYFCEKCALLQFRKSKKCFICQAAIDGQFEVAAELTHKITKKRAQLEEEKNLMKKKWLDDTNSEE